MSSTLFLEPLMSNEQVPQTFLENPLILFKQNQIIPKINWVKIMSIDPENYNSIKPYIKEILNLKLSKQEINNLPNHYVVHLVTIIKKIKKMEAKKTKIDKLNAFRHKRHKNPLIIEANPSYKGYKIKCDLCPGKYFTSYRELSEHMNRTHLIIKDYNNKENINEKNMVKKHKKYYHTKHPSMQILTSNKDIDLSTQCNSCSMLNIKNEFNILNEKLNQLEKSVSQLNQNFNYTSSTFVPLQNCQTEMNFDYNINENSYNTTKTEFNINYDKQQNILETMITDMKDKISKNNKESNTKFKGLMAEMAKFKLSISSEISNFKQGQSFTRVLNLFNKRTENITTHSSQNGIQRSSRKHHTEKVPQKKQIEIIEKIKKIDNDKAKQISNYKEMISISNTHLELKAFSPNSSVRERNLTDIKNNSFQKDLVISSKVINESINDSKTMQKDSSTKKLQTKSINPHKFELLNFFNKFKDRDGHLNGHINNYLQRLTPRNYKINSTFTKNHIEILKNNRIKSITNNKIHSTNDIQFMSKIELIKLLNKVYENIGDRSTFNDFYGYYGKNLDFLFNLKGFLDEANDIFYGGDKKSNTNNEEYNYKTAYNGVFDVINYDVIDSQSFSFKELDNE